MTAKEPEMLGCPFCEGGTTYLIISGDDKGDLEDFGLYVTCINCLADGPFEQSKEEAIAAWNRRAP